MAMPPVLARPVLLGCLLALSLRPTSGQEADLVVLGGMVVDGSGGSPDVADVAIAEGRILAVGTLTDFRADDTIDAGGLYVAPGFIDLHSHADPGLSDPHRADARNLVAQGITAVVVGQDSWHPWPVGGDLATEAGLWRRHGVGPNVIPLVGPLAVRREVMGWSQDTPTEAEGRRIDELIGRYLDQGAWGLSTALEFTPYVSPDEVTRALRPVAERDAVYVSHLRSQADGIVAALEEFLATVREAGVRAVVSHLKVRGERNWGLAPRLVGMLREARREGLHVWADHTPYLTSSSDIPLVPVMGPREGLDDDVLPPGAGSPDDLLRWGYRLDGRDPPISHLYDLGFLLRQGPERRRRIAESVARRLVDDEPLRRRWLRGALAEERTADSLLAETARRIADRDGAHRIRVFDHPGPAVVSDGWVSEHGVGTGSPPRSYGAFVRRLERYVVEQELLELPEAIRQVTSLPAEILELRGRGRIAPGHAADLVIFDLEGLRDRATFQEPHRYPGGIEWVLVNGEPVVARGVATGARPGSVLLREGGR